MKRSVPILITCDVDPTPEAALKDKRRAMELTLRLFDEYGVKGTFFFVANVAKDYRSQIHDLMEQRHEIGCHGLSHDASEEYHQLPEEDQRERLITATRMISEITGNGIQSFRGPRVKTSHTTQQILEELNYKADSSVCSQRLDFLSSNLINLNWLLAPRLPYRPSRHSAFRKGERNLFVVPVSAIVFPFVSGMLYTFGVAFMKALFRLLYYESVKTGKPIVYLLHPAEFAQKTLKTTDRYSVRVEGFRFRRSACIFEQDTTKRYDYHRALFSYMKSFNNSRFTTMNQYVETL